MSSSFEKLTIPKDVLINLEQKIQRLMQNTVDMNEKNNKADIGLNLVDFFMKHVASDDTRELYDEYNLLNP